MASASDNFNRADGALGGNWTGNGGSVSIVSNTAAGGSSLAHSAARHSAVTWADNQEISATIASVGSAAGVAGRLSTSGTTATYYVALAETNQTLLYKVIAGTPSILAGVITNWVPGDTITLRIVGTSLEARRNGSVVATATDSSITSGAAGVAFYHNAGRIDNWSATDLTPPTAPSGLSATATGVTTIGLVWTDNSSDETGFKIERAPDGVTFAQIATVGAGVTSYNDGGLSDTTTYTYRVRAYNDNGDSSYSATAAATTLTGPPTIRVKIAFGDGPFAASPTYTDVTSRLRNDEPITIKRGRQSELGRVETGEASFVLDNRDRAFDPLYTASPYYPNVKPRRRVQIEINYAGSTYILFTGFARFQMMQGAGGSRDNLCKVRALDAFDLFGRMPLTERLLLEWTPTPTTSTPITLLSGLPTVPGTAQFRIALTGAPAGTQTVTVTGTRTDGTSTTESFALTSANYSAGVSGVKVFRTITQLDSVYTASPHQAVQIYAVPAYDDVISGGFARPDTHIGYVLDYAGYPAGLRSLAAGGVNVSDWSPSQASGWSSSFVVSGADTILTALQRLGEAEGGIVYIRGDGAVVFEAAETRQSSYFPNATVLGSGADEVPVTYPRDALDDGDDYVANQVNFSRQAGGGVSAYEASSAEINDYGRRIYSRTGLLIRTKALIDNQAKRTLYHRKTAIPRVRSAIIEGSPATWSTMVGADLSTLLVARLRPPNVGDSVDVPSWVERLEWRIVRGGDGINATLALSLSPATLGNDLYRTISGAGMAFPTTPYTDQLFYRDDLDLLCYWDGTRWLTAHEYEADFTEIAANPIAAGTSDQTVRVYAPRADYSLLVTRVSVLTFVATTNNGSNYRTISFRRDTTSVWTFNTSAHSANTWVRTENQLNAIYTIPTFYQLRLDANVGSPGTLYVAGSLRYRLVVT